MRIIYFKGIDNAEDLKKAYHRLARIHHPDIGGDTKTMQAINAEYEYLFKQLKNIHKGSNGENFTAETEENVREYPEIINKIIGFQCDIEIIGSWIWCFNAYSCKEELKKLGFKFAARRKAWIWKPEGSESHCRKKMSLDEIRDLHGSEKVKNKTMPRLAVC